MNIFITGTNRGLGLEFVKQYLGKGHTILATSRNPVKATHLQKLKNKYPDQLHLIPMDLDKPEVIQRAGQTASNLVPYIDILVNNAGAGTRQVDASRKKALTQLDSLDSRELSHMIRINAVGPLLVIKELQALLGKAANAKVINISSVMGSISQRQNGGTYGYSGSKTLLNMFSRLVSFDLLSSSIIVVALHPGWVQTDMGGPAAEYSPHESVTNMINLIDGFGKAQSGRFFNLLGQEIPW